MVLTGNSPQMNIASDVYINAGAIRAKIDGLTPSFGPNNILALRGGVLEADAGGSTHTFARDLGNTIVSGVGQVNWSNPIQLADRGGGGFSVVNGNLNVNIGNSQTLVWNGTTGGNQFFLRSGQPLRLGSFQSNGVVTLVNNLALDDGSGGLPPESREINVESLTGPIPLYTQRSRLTGVITGSSATSLLKVGPAILELTGDNAYAGGTIVGMGALVVNNTTGSATGTGRVVAHGMLMGNGVIAPASGNGVTFLQNPLAGFPTLALYRDQFGGTPGHLTIGSAGANNPVTFRPGAITVVQLNGTTFDPAGGATSYGRLTVRGTGTITLSDTPLTVGLNDGFVPSNTDVFGILDNQTGNAITGTFASGGVVNAVLLDGTVIGTFQISYAGDITGGGISITGGNDIVLHGFAPVPEPGAVLALCAGAVGIVGVARRVRRRHAGAA
jgi:autotransporter-associated beta strand protein